jgi:hypothetical protein
VTFKFDIEELFTFDIECSTSNMNFLPSISNVHANFDIDPKVVFDIDSKVVYDIEFFDIEGNIHLEFPKGLSFISNRQRRIALHHHSRHVLCVGVGGDRTHIASSKGEGYARLCQQGSPEMLNLAYARHMLDICRLGSLPCICLENIS